MSYESIIEQVFTALGLNSEWTPLDVIDQGCHYILANKTLLTESLPKRVVGDLTLLQSDVPLLRRKSLLAFARRLAGLIDTAILRRRKQVREKKKTVSKYSYRLVRA
jgi:hypothetical protein